jgi:hypothetical protein
MRALLLLAALAAVGCGRPAEAPEPAAKVEAPKPKPPDESRRFPREGRTSMELVDDHLLGKEFLPGGNVASYEQDGKRYQMFLIVTEDPESAALLGFDVKSALTGAKLVPHFGGYFGMDGETPWFVFPKTKHLLGIVGLPQAEADALARDFAARVD